MSSTSIPAMPGIYRIVCSITGKFYIGSACDLRKRWQMHHSLLTRNSHHSIALQRAWNKYGEGVFAFEILELVLVPEMLTVREQHYFDMFKPFGNKGYNILPIAGSSLGHKASPETRAKLSKARMGNTNHTGKPASPETRAKLSAVRVGRKRSLEHNHKIALARTGKPRSPETVEKMRQNRTNTKTLMVIAPDGTEYTVRGIRQFCETHNLDRRSIQRVAQGKFAYHKGYKARYA